MGNISNALPIQWWAISAKTYNETQFGFVRSKPYIHQWQCDDPIKDQISDEPDITKEYAMRIKDRLGASIIDLDYVKSLIDGPSIYPVLQLPNIGFIATLSPWLQHGNPSFQTVWSWVSNGVIISDGSITGYEYSYNLYALRPDGYSFGWPPGDYTIHITGNNASTGMGASTMFCTIDGSNDGFTTSTHLNSSGAIALGAFSIDISFTLEDYIIDIAFAFRIGAPGNQVILNVNTSSFTLAPTNETYAEYDLEFTGEEQGLCDKYVQFFINASNGGTLDGDTLDSDTLDTIDDANNIYKSDFHLFKKLIPIDAYNGSQLVYYKQLTNYASLDYPNTGNYFALRLPVKFFEEREQVVQTSINLTSKVIDTSEFIKFQRWLQVPVLPKYILRKLVLILAHSKKGSLLIDGLEWTKQESTNRSRPGGDIKYPEQMADVWLTEKNTAVRNLI